jgi:hypothetical protein
MRLRAVIIAALVVLSWPTLTNAQTSICGNGAVEAGEQCDPFDTYVPVQGSDRHTRCTCECKLLPLKMPLTLKMGGFYLVCGILIFALKGSFKQVSFGLILRMLAALSVGIALVVWGSLEWAGSVSAPFDDGTGVLFHQEAGIDCEDTRGHQTELIGRSPAQ